MADPAALLKSRSDFTDDKRILALDNELRDVKILLAESEKKRVELETEIDDLKATLNEVLEREAQSRAVRVATTNTIPSSGIGGHRSPMPSGLSVPGSVRIGGDDYHSPSASPQNHHGSPHHQHLSSGGHHGHHASSPQGSPAGGTKGASAILPLLLHSSSDKAKATILQLRMERMVQIRRRQQEDIKRLGLVCLGALNLFKKEWMTFKQEFLLQMERTGNALVAISANVSTDTHEEVEAQLYPPLSSSHPVAKDLGLLCDGVDELTRALQQQWYTFGCFMRGPVPVVGRTKRFLDPSVNVVSYQVLTKKLKHYVEFATAVNLVKAEMRLPNLVRSTTAAVIAANAAFVDSLDDLFMAIRLVRSPFSSSIRSLSLALRICLSIDVCRPEVQELMDRFNSLAARHTRRCFQYISHTIRIGRQYARAVGSAQAARMRVFDYDSLDCGVLELSGGGGDRFMMSAGSSDLTTCPTCNLLTVCDDCVILKSNEGMLKELIEERRTLIVSFTARRVEHFHKLSLVAAEVLKLMNRYKLTAPSLNTKDAKVHAARSLALSQKAREMAALVFRAEVALREAARAREEASHGGVSRAGDSYAGTTLLPDGDIDWVSQAAAAISGKPTNSILTSPGRPGGVSNGMLLRVGGGANNVATAATPAAAPLRPLMGPFGESLFPMDEYFQRRRAHTAQEQRRRIMQHNAVVLQNISTLETPGGGAMMMGGDDHVEGGEEPITRRFLSSRSGRNSNGMETPRPPTSSSSLLPRVPTTGRFGIGSDEQVAPQSPATATSVQQQQQYVSTYLNRIPSASFNQQRHQQQNKSEQRPAVAITPRTPRK